MKLYYISVVYIFVLLFFMSCISRNDDIIDLFSVTKEIQPQRKSPRFDLNNSRNIVSIYCDDSLFITLDEYDGYNYSMFDANSGKFIRRFGKVGHGKGEMSAMCWGKLRNKTFVAFDDATKVIGFYDLEGHDEDRIVNYEARDAHMADMAVIDTSCYIGCGTYRDRYHYWISRIDGSVLSYGSEIYNLEDNTINEYHKFLSNQGGVIIHPTRNLFVGYTYSSSIIDFCSFDGMKIQKVKSYNLHLPEYRMIERGNGYSTASTDNTINGFISADGNQDYVFALYSGDKFKDNPLLSKNILVFDWYGNPIVKLELPHYASSVSVNSKYLYTVEIDESGKQMINAYDIEIQ